MKILVLGGNGMAGHVLRYYFLTQSDQLYYTIREQSDDPLAVTLDLTDEKAVHDCLKNLQPDYVINAAGILNEDAGKRLKEAIYINSLLPHKLAFFGNELGFRLIHISTDCVFSGTKGNYQEDDIKDGDTSYAITKSLGEVDDGKHVTIRTSIIGPEIREHGIGLFHWFMGQTGDIKGYRQAFWNGVTTLELAKAISWVLTNKITGLVHLTGTRRLSKYELLMLFKQTFNKDNVEIIPYDNKIVDKTLVNTREDFSYNVLEYEQMIMEMRQWMENHRQLYSGYNFN